jgi:predicted ATP-grasp superfamily ATP-dependent carboligase
MMTIDCKYVEKRSGGTMRESLEELAMLDPIKQPTDAVSSEPETDKVLVPRRHVAYDALVLDAQLRQALVSVRSLGRRGLRVAALGLSSLPKNTRYVPAFASCWCQRAYIAPTYEHEAAPFLLYLKQLLNGTGARVLIPSSEGTLALLREYRKDIGQRTQIALAKDGALEAVTNKDLMLTIAERLGIGVPGGAFISTIDDVPEAIRAIGLPAVIEPVEPRLGNDRRQGRAHGVRLTGVLVTTPDEASRAVEELAQHYGRMLFQRFLSGSSETVSFLYAHGEMYARFAQLTRRTQPPLGGTSVYRHSIALPPDIVLQAERLVREIELEGYSEVEFRRDNNGKPYLMKVNPLLSASVEVAVRAGVDFPYLLYRWANGDRINRVEGYRVGRWMRNLEGDILTTIQCFTQRGTPGVMPPMQALREFFTAFFTPADYDYLDIEDLRPAWVAMQALAHRSVQKFSPRHE